MARCLVRCPCWFTISLKAVLQGYFAPGTFPINEYIYKTHTLYVKVIMFIVNILKIRVPICYSPKANRDAGLLSLC